MKAQGISEGIAKWLLFVIIGIAFVAFGIFVAMKYFKV